MTSAFPRKSAAKNINANLIGIGEEDLMQILLWNGDTFRVFEYKSEFRPGPMPGHIKLDPSMAIATPLDIHKKFAGGEACEAFSGNVSHILQIIPKDPRVKIKIDYAMLRERGAYRCAILRGQALSFVRQVNNGEDVAQGFRSLIDRRRLDPNQFLLLMDIEPIDCGDGRS